MADIETADLRENPSNRAAVIVIPDRDTPGIRAKLCAIPIIIRQPKERSFKVFFPLNLSAKPKISPKNIVE